MRVCVFFYCKKKKEGIKLKQLKKIMPVFVVLLILFNMSAGLQANSVDIIDGVQTSPKTTDDVFNETERVYGHRMDTTSKTMTTEEATKKGLQVIGQTTSGRNIYSTATREVVDAFIRDPQGAQTFATAGSGYVMYWNGTYGTPMIFMDGLGWVYCIEPYEAYPADDWYDEGTWLDDDGLLAILLWGFPRNFGGQHGLSDEDAYLRTFVALNAYIGTYTRATIEGYGDAYVNMLLAKADARDLPSETYTIHEPSNKQSTYNKAQKRLETNMYEITGVQDAQFWLENLPNDFYMVDTDGNKQDRLTIPGKFRLATDNLKYKGEVSFDVKTNINESAVVKFTAPGVQDLISIATGDPLPAYKASAFFQPATGGFRGKKEDTNGSLVTGAVFTLFEDEAGTKVAKDVEDKDVSVTTKNGEFEYSDNVVAGDYWLHERKPDGSSGAPRGYWELDKPVPVTIEAGEVVDVPVITNIFKERVQLAIEKMNEYGRPISNLIFDVYRKSDDMLVDTITTDANGKAYSKFLPGNRINAKTGLEEKIEYYAVERQYETYVPIIYVDFPITEKDADDRITVKLVNYHLRLAVDGFKMDEEMNVLPGTIYGMYDAQGRELALTEVDTEGRFQFQEVRFDLFFNSTDKTSKFADTYVGEIQTVDDDKYALDIKKYHLPNLEGKFDDYKMGDVISLSTKTEPFVNKFLRGIIELVKVDEKDNEKVLPGATFKFERLSGRDVAEAEDNGIVDDDVTENDDDDTPETKADDIDVKQTFELTTDEEGRVQQSELLYGEWIVTEIKAPNGYILPLDEHGAPKNSLRVTINEEMRKISLKFYNQKKPEVLVSTGSNLPSAFIALGVAIVLLSLTLLAYVRRNTFVKWTKKAYIAIIVVCGITLGATTLAAAEVLDVTPAEMFSFILPKKKMAIQTVVTPYKIDPTDDDNAIFDPIDRTGNDTKIEETVVEGDKQQQQGQDNVNETKNINMSNSNGGSANTKRSTNDALVSTGEQIGLNILIGLLVFLISGLILFIIYVRNEKQARNER